MMSFAERDVDREHTCRAQIFHPESHPSL